MMELLGLAFLAWPFTLMMLIIIALVIGITLAIVYSTKRGKNPLVCGVIGFLVVFMLIFWDWIPTKLAHQYCCSKEAGFWVYKTLDQWKQENPGVNKTLFRMENAPSVFKGDDDNNTTTYVRNSRINWVVKFNKEPLNRWRHEELVVDVKNNEVLARYVDFSTSSARQQAGWSGWKFWLYSEHCPDAAIRQYELRHFLQSFDGASRAH